MAAAARGPEGDDRNALPSVWPPPQGAGHGAAVRAQAANWWHRTWDRVVPVSDAWIATQLPVCAESSGCLRSQRSGSAATTTGGRASGRLRPVAPCLLYAAGLQAESPHSGGRLGRPHGKAPGSSSAEPPSTEAASAGYGHTALPDCKTEEASYQQLQLTHRDGCRSDRRLWLLHGASPEPSRWPQPRQSGRCESGWIPRSVPMTTHSLRTHCRSDRWVSPGPGPPGAAGPCNSTEYA
jgi:hypothetical protein